MDTTRCHFKFQRDIFGMRFTWVVSIKHPDQWNEWAVSYFKATLKAKLLNKEWVVELPLLLQYTQRPRGVIPEMLLDSQLKISPSKSE